MAYYTIQQLKDMHKRYALYPIVRGQQIGVLLALIEDLLDAYKLLDEQAEEYTLQTRRKEP